MNTLLPEPTEPDLLDAYRRTGLEQLGIPFERALQIPGIRQSLTGMIRAERMWAQNAHLQGSRYLERTMGETSR